MGNHPSVLLFALTRRRTWCPALLGRHHRFCRRTVSQGAQQIREATSIRVQFRSDSPGWFPLEELAADDSIPERDIMVRTLLISVSAVWMWSLCGVTADAQDMHISQVLIPGEDWQLVSEGHQFTEGPAADATGQMYFVDVPSSQIFKVQLNGTVQRFAENSGKASGLAIGPEGRIYAAQSGNKQIVWYDPVTAQPTVLATDINPNDLMVDRQGVVYVTDMPGKKVWRVLPTGEKSVVAEGFMPNGLTLWTDGGTLVIADWEQPHLWAYRVEADASLKYGAPYYGPLQIPSGQKLPGSDGMTVDDAGRLYVATHAGVQVFDPIGRHSGTIAKPQNKFLSNVDFGGPEYDTLYVTCSDKVFKRKLKTKGTPFVAVTHAAK
jgi:gluconolactonase